MEAISEEALIGALGSAYRHAFALCLERSGAQALLLSAAARLDAQDTPEDQAPAADLALFAAVRHAWLDSLKQPGKGSHASRRNSDRPIDGSGVSKVAPARLEPLSAEEREILSLICGAGISYRDASRMLAIPMSALMNRLARARWRFAAATGMLGDDDAQKRPSLAEEMLMAHADGELTAAGLATIERTLASNPALSDVLSMFVQTRAAISDAIAAAAGKEPPPALRKNFVRRLRRERKVAKRDETRPAVGIPGLFLAALLLCVIGFSGLYVGSKQMGYSNVVTRMFDSALGAAPGIGTLRPAGSSTAPTAGS